MKYTPNEIAKDKILYTIPIYQRLFEWNTENIVTLLEDLKKKFEHRDGKDDYYYIGMLTSTKNNELVDGQQRFTVMMLLGCVLQDYCEEWKNFLIVDNKLRLEFSSRPLDNKYLWSLVEHKGEENQSFENLKMRNGYERIRDFMQDMTNISKEDFASYIFHNLCFFISNLPEGYSPKDLNKYFERMNTTGKNLEQHEILKVKLLSNLDNDIDKYMLLWNKLADVDTLLIRRRKDENIAEIKQQAMKADINTIFSYDLINGLKEDTYDNTISIGNLEMSASAPKNEREINRDSRCALSFPYLLLQVLYRQLSKKNDCRIDELSKKINYSVNDFFKPSSLLSIFEKFLPYSSSNINKDAIKEFMEMLVRARLALDICFIRPTEYGYTLDMNLDEDNSVLRKLLMFQSMLYVSSSNYTDYRWFNWLMDEIDRDGIPDAESLYTALKRNADEEFPLPSYEQLAYGGDNRYWFWRLDYYIWQHRKELFEKESPEVKNIVENYVFKRNRSIEHIAPQKPQSDSTMKWNNTEEDKTLRDSFGNLVMISQSLNSSLKNESYEVKAAHVKSYCNGSKSGSIESLKLLTVYRDYPDKWNREAITNHGKLMYEWLQKSKEE